MDYVVTDGTARHAADYVLAGGHLQWGAGDTMPRAVVATVIDDPVRDAPFHGTVVVPAGSTRVPVAMRILAQGPSTVSRQFQAQLSGPTIGTTADPVAIFTIGAVR